jgi:hypothetical protein
MAPGGNQTGDTAMADKSGGAAADNIMSPAEMKPLLMLSKREPVNAVIGMTKNHEGVILLSKRIKPKKLIAQLKADARKVKIELDATSLRFGKAEVDTDKDASLVIFTVNKDAPGALRIKLLELVKRVSYSKVEIDIDAKFEAELDEDDEQAGTSQAGPSQTVDAAPVPVAVPVGDTVSPPIQRDSPTAQETEQNLPPGATKQGGPLSITKRYDPANASREEVIQALTNYLNKELALQGTRQLAVTDRVRWAVLKLFKDNPDGYKWFESRSSKVGLPESPTDFAAMVGTHLPDFIPRKNMLHLDVPPTKDPDPTTLGGKGKVILKGKLGDLGKIPEDVGNPNGPVEAPSNEPTIGSSPGQHTVTTPNITWGGKPPKSPKPNLPQEPLAREQEAVKTVVQSLDDNALVPAAAKGTPQAAEFGGARLLAQDIADHLAAAEAIKKGTVEVTIGMNYRHVDDLREIFEKIEVIVRQIAAVLPGGVKDVDKVIISPTRTGKADKYPPEWVVKLHNGG